MQTKPAGETSVNEISALVDISRIDSSYLNVVQTEIGFLRDLPGIEGETYVEVFEISLVGADRYTAITPGANVDGVRTIFVAAELREVIVKLVELEVA